MLSPARVAVLLLVILFNFSRGYRLLRRHRMVMAGGFGAPKPSTAKKQPAKEATSSPQYKLTKKGDGTATASNHCPTLDLAWPRLRCVHHDPPVFEIDRFLPHDVCDEIVARAQCDGVMVSSRTFSADFASKRTSTTWYVPYATVPELLDPLNRLTGWPITQFEEPQVVRYEIGQQFSWHYDAIPKSLQDDSGNRLGTFIVYLNDVEGGAGATCFKDLGIQVKPEKGKALLFFPCTKDGVPDERTLHAGQVAMDTKWILQVWVHERDYSPKTPTGTNHRDGIEAVERLRAAKDA